MEKNDLLNILRLAHEQGKDKTADNPLRLAVVSNFTDDTLVKLLTGLCLSEGITVNIYQTPFKQYLFELKSEDSPLARHNASLTFIFFDANPYADSELLSEGHVQDVVRDIERYCRSGRNVVLHKLAEPSTVQHGRLMQDGELHKTVRNFNERANALAKKCSGLSLLDTGALIASMGEDRARNLRGLYAWGLPWSNDFLFAVAREWMAHVCALSGRTHKCIVLDLDNTLWGGILGEAGPLGVELGLEYPGNAYREFQRALLGLHDRGIILAINSRNNAADVDEMFEKNPHMILKKQHFASIRTNWEDKTSNLRSIAEELNIGPDSMIFIDDDPLNRALVARQLPMILVPEWSLPPEEYVRTLLQLDVFHARALTPEDRERGAMYAQERERKEVLAESSTLGEYLATLNIEVDISVNNPAFTARVAQLTQKTNQYNLSTRRSSDAEVSRFMSEGGLVFAGDVRDTFGSYGVTIVALVRPLSPNTAELHTFLMSCRVMGRGVEKAFFHAIVKYLSAKGVTALSVMYVPSVKNTPIAGLLPSMGAEEVSRGPDGAVSYRLVTGDPGQMGGSPAIRVTMI